MMSELKPADQPINQSSTLRSAILSVLAVCHLSLNVSGESSSAWAGECCGMGCPDAGLKYAQITLKAERISRRVLADLNEGSLHAAMSRLATLDGVITELNAEWDEITRRDIGEAMADLTPPEHIACFVPYARALVTVRVKGRVDADRRQIIARADRRQEEANLSWAVKTFMKQRGEEGCDLERPLKLMHSAEVSLHIPEQREAGIETLVKLQKSDLMPGRWGYIALAEVYQDQWNATLRDRAIDQCVRMSKARLKRVCGLFLKAREREAKGMLKWVKAAEESQRRGHFKRSVINGKRALSLLESPRVLIVDREEHMRLLKLTRGIIATAISRCRALNESDEARCSALLTERAP